MTRIPTSSDPAGFRSTLGCFPTGVAIVTTMSGDDDPIGLTISSFNSVSMDPPLILWSLGLKAWSLPLFRENGGFVINVLSADQAHLPGLFSSQVEDRFAEVDWHKGVGGRPVLDGCSAVFECRTYARYDGGDHEIFLGEVQHHSASEAVPLVFGKGRLAPLFDPV